MSYRTLGPDGKWYGTTTEGGSFGGGTIFRLEEVETGETSPPPPPAGTFSFSAGTISSDPQTGVATLTVTRSVTTGAATVSYRTLDGNAKAGVDYTATTGVLTFADGQASQTITASLLGGAIAGHNLTVALFDPSANAALGPVQAAEVPASRRGRQAYDRCRGDRQWWTSAHSGRGSRPSS